MQSWECFNIEEGVGGKPAPVDKFVRQHIKFLYFLEVGGVYVPRNDYSPFKASLMSFGYMGSSLPVIKPSRGVLIDSRHILWSHGMLP